MGREPDAIYTTVANGRHGVMPALGAVLGEQGVNEVASYVVSLSGGKAPQDWVASGKQRFETICAGCHGVNATGNPILGAPNLADDVWLHGRDFDSIRATITNGRDNQMPAHLEMLGEAKVRLLAAYVMSLSAGSWSASTDVKQTQAAVEAETSAGSPAETERDEGTSAVQLNGDESARVLYDPNETPILLTGGGS